MYYSTFYKIGINPLIFHVNILFDKKYTYGTINLVSLYTVNVAGYYYNSFRHKFI